MSFTVRISKATKPDISSFRAGRVAVWLRITSLAVILVLAGAVAMGVPLHSSDRGCNMRMETSGYEQMGMEPSTQRVTAIALCCLLDCVEPGATGTTFNLRIPAFKIAFVHPAVLTVPATLVRPLPQEKWLQSASFTPPHTYLKNLALLI